MLPFVGLRTPANYVLPVIALSLYPISMIARLTRSSDARGHETRLYHSRAFQRNIV